MQWIRAKDHVDIVIRANERSRLLPVEIEWQDDLLDVRIETHTDITFDTVAYRIARRFHVDGPLFPGGKMITVHIVPKFLSSEVQDLELRPVIMHNRTVMPGTSPDHVWRYVLPVYSEMCW